MPNMSNIIKKTMFYGSFLHSLATPNNTTNADNGRDNKVESNLNLQQSKDNDNSWSFIILITAPRLIGHPSITGHLP